MRYLQRFESYNSMENQYSALYISPLILDATYCYGLSLYDPEFQRLMRQYVNEINSLDYDWVVKLDRDKVQPGCIIRGDKQKIKQLSEECYRLFSQLPGCSTEGYDQKSGCRIVYGTGRLNHIDPETIHRSGSGMDILVNIGRKLDSLKGQVGIYNATESN